MNDEQIKEFEFDLIFALPRKDLDQDAIVDALFEAACDDAVVGLGAPGLLGLAFTRGGEDAESVFVDALKAALSVLPDGTTLCTA